MCKGAQEFQQPTARSIMADYRRETDLLGTRDVPAEALWGVHTLRAMENFPLAGRPVHRGLVHAFGAVKLAAAQTNHELGWADEAKFAAIQAACRGDDRRPARRPRRGRCPARRGRHLDQHERQRGAGQPGPAAAWPAARRLRRRQPARRHQPPPVDQRHLSHGPAGGGHRRPAPAAAQGDRPAWRHSSRRRRSSPTWSRSAAPSCRTPC